MLAASARSREAHDVADLWPVDRIKQATFRADWHDADSESCRTRTKGQSLPGLNCRRLREMKVAGDIGEIHPPRWKPNGTIAGRDRHRVT